MRDIYGRSINYLRLSITDRCNLRCRYCMPATGIKQCSHHEILRYEDYLKIVKAASPLGVRKVRVTGGEPLVRKGVVSFLDRLAGLTGIEEVVLTTNGQNLSSMARKLKDAGVKRLNVSLDSLQEDTYAFMTRGGSLAAVLEGIGAAETAGLNIKLNMVVLRGINDHEVLAFAELSRSRPWAVRFIEYMPTTRDLGWRSQLVSGREILNQLHQNYALNPLTRGPSCGPAQPYRIAGALGTIGIISSSSNHFCGSCNRIRITTTGQVKSCLFSDKALDIKPHLEAGSDHIRHVLQEIITCKPARHDLLQEDSTNAPFSMAQIGG